MADFTLQVHDIDESGKSYEFAVKAAWVQAQLADAGLRPNPPAGDGTLRVRAQKNGNEYLVYGTFQASALTDCVRCLGEAVVPVDVNITGVYTRGAAPDDPSDVEVGDEDLDEDSPSQEYFSGHEIELDSLVREHFVLEVPMQPLCSPTCAGIPMPKHVKPPEDVFGPGEGGVDPRLAPLMRLRDKVPAKKKS